MIIYASSIWLDNATPLIDVFSTITYWFHQKTKEQIYPETFLDCPRRKFGDDSVLEILKNDDRHPIMNPPRSKLRGIDFRFFLC